MMDLLLCVWDTIQPSVLYVTYLVPVSTQWLVRWLIHFALGLGDTVNDIDLMMCFSDIIEGFLCAFRTDCSTYFIVLFLIIDLTNYLTAFAYQPKWLNIKNMSTLISYQVPKYYILLFLIWVIGDTLIIFMESKLK